MGEISWHKHFKCCFHSVVEDKNYMLARILLTVGVNPNSKEGCGATPMSIAVMNADTNMSKLLLENFAEYSGALFGTFPSPLQMAVAIKLVEIVDLFNVHSQNKTQWINAIQSECIFKHNRPTQSPSSASTDGIECDSSSEAKILNVKD